MGATDAAIRPDRVALYIRWSTEEQGDGTTLAEQREGCQLYVRSQGWAVNPNLEFIDDGYSGASLVRPAMERLRTAVKAALVDCVVVFKIDRLSRNIVDATRLVLEEWQGSCHLRCVRQPIDTTSETGRMLFAILATFADFERSQITERTYLGRLRRIREGRVYGGAFVPFGLQATGSPGERQRHPSRAPIVEALFKRAEQGASAGELVAWLASEAVQPPGGGRWRVNSVRHILRNPIYMGRIWYGRSPSGAKGRRRINEQPLVDVAGATLPVLVSPERFAAVQAQLDRRRSPQSGRVRDGGHLLSGVAVCACGHAMHIHWSRGARYYICGGRVAHGRDGCPSDSGLVQADRVEAAIGEEVVALYGGIDRAAEAAQCVTAQMGGQPDGAVKSELRRVERRLEELSVAAADGRLSLDEWRQLRERLQAKRGQCMPPGFPTEVPDVQEVLHYMRGMHRWADLGPNDQKRLLRLLVERAELCKPKGRNQPVTVAICWRFSPTV